MSAIPNPDGSGETLFVCDRCGADVGNGGIDQCVIVSDLDPDAPGMIRNLHFCRKAKCDGKILSASNIDAYSKRHKPKVAREPDPQVAPDPKPDPKPGPHSMPEPRKRTSARKTVKAKSTRTASKR